jgi:hypothetical protein
VEVRPSVHKGVTAKGVRSPDPRLSTLLWRLCALGRVSNMAPAAEFLDSQGEVVKFTLLRHAALIKIQDISQLITIILVLRACVVAAEEFFG